MQFSSMHHSEIVVLFSVTLAVEQSLFTQWKPSQGQRKKNTSVQSCISAVLNFWSCSYISAVLKCCIYTVTDWQCCISAVLQCCRLTVLRADLDGFWLDWMEKPLLHSPHWCTVQCWLCPVHCVVHWVCAVHCSLSTLVQCALCTVHSTYCAIQTRLLFPIFIFTATRCAQCTLCHTICANSANTLPYDMC